jgi:hypothetical protein
MSIHQSPDVRSVVILERDDLIRALLERWLGDAGYRIVQDPVPGPPALVVADVAHPRQAESVARDLAGRYGAPLLLTSGRIRAEVGLIHESVRQFGVRRVLPKPFTRDEFLLAVEETLKVA